MGSGLPFDWIISDTHFGHRNISKYAWRTTPVFPTPEAVDNLMYHNWRESVGDDESILHLGDVCHWGQGEPIPELAGMPGRKFLVKGNHDNYPDSWYEDHGFTIVTPREIMFHHVCELGEATVWMDHYPKHPLPPQMVSVHGHVHRNPHHSTPSHINVSVELTHFCPIRLERVVESVMWHHTRERRQRHA